MKSKICLIFSCILLFSSFVIAHCYIYGECCVTAKWYTGSGKPGDPIYVHWNIRELSTGRVHTYTILATDEANDPDADTLDASLWEDIRIWVEVCYPGPTVQIFAIIPEESC